MLKKMRSVKHSESVFVLGKVCGNPIHNYPDSVPVTAVNKRFKLSRRAIAAVYRIIAGDLITPASVKRILAYRHKLYMGIAHRFNIRDKLVNHFGVGIVASVILALP